MVLEWMFGGAGCHAMSKGVELLYNICYLITEAFFPLFILFILFFLIPKFYLYQFPCFIFTGNIMICLVRNVLAYIYFPTIITVPHSFVLVVDIICIDPITSYLDSHVGPIFHIYSSIVNSWFSNTSYFPDLEI